MAANEVSLEMKVNFMIGAFTSAVSYFDGFAGRIWTRFSLLLSVEAGLAGLFVALWTGEKVPGIDKQLILALFGLLMSVLMYVQSAQDKFVLEELRSQINRLKIRIEDELGLEHDLPILFTPTSPDVDVAKFSSIGSWRVKAISTTRLPALISLVFIGMWITLGAVLLLR
jgi:hypothetical protein